MLQLRRSLGRPSTRHPAEISNIACAALQLSRLNERTAKPTADHKNLVTALAARCASGRQRDAPGRYCRPLNHDDYKDYSGTITKTGPSACPTGSSPELGSDSERVLLPSGT
ncbi:hypothetical protein N7540_004179 [Penicillium herquei]|nr:hypothetical protein N7540_004179 [Penicillium herquei]